MHAAVKLTLATVTTSFLLAQSAAAYDPIVLEGTIPDIRIFRFTDEFGRLHADFSISMRYRVTISSLMGEATVSCVSAPSKVHGRVEAPIDGGSRLLGVTDRGMPEAVSPHTLDLLVTLPDPHIVTGQIAIRCQGGIPAPYGGALEDAYNVTSSPPFDRLYCRQPNIPGTIPKRLNDNWCEEIGGRRIPADEARLIHRKLLSREIWFFDMLQSVVAGSYDFNWSNVAALFRTDEAEDTTPLAEERPAAPEALKRLRESLAADILKRRAEQDRDSAPNPVPAPVEQSVSVVQPTPDVTTSPRDALRQGLAATRNEQVAQERILALLPDGFEAQIVADLAAAEEVCRASGPRAPVRQGAPFTGLTLYTIPVSCSSRHPYNRQAREACERERAENRVRARERERIRQQEAAERRREEEARFQANYARWTRENAQWEASVLPGCLQAARTESKSRMDAAMQNARETLSQRESQSQTLGDRLRQRAR